MIPNNKTELEYEITRLYNVIIGNAAFIGKLANQGYLDHVDEVVRDNNLVVGEIDVLKKRLKCFGKPARLAKAKREFTEAALDLVLEYEQPNNIGDVAVYIDRLISCKKTIVKIEAE